MKKMKNTTLLVISILFLSIFVFSCSHEKTKKIKVFTYKVGSDSAELRDTLYVIKKIKQFDTRTIELYSFPEQDSVHKFLIEQFKKQEQKLRFQNDTCELIASKIYKLNESRIEIFKYNLDRKEAADEESYIYYNPDIGLIAYYNYVWGIMEFLEYDSSKELREMFLSDTTVFVGIR